MRKLLVATQNQGKTFEICQLLADLKWQIVSLEEFPSLPNVEESGTTFVQNALIKARYYFSHTGLLSLSDDSGLEIKILNGAPGIYSARYAGPQATDRDRYKAILAALSQVPAHQREARFVCAVALVGENIEQVFTATVPGQILFAPRGELGFGYDPIFEYPPLSKTFAEMSPSEKASISHRGQALKQVREFLSHLA